MGCAPTAQMSPHSCSPEPQLPLDMRITRGACEPRTVMVAECCPRSMLRPEAWRVEDFRLHKQLYKGKASLLYSATCRASGTPVALKLYRKARLSELNWYQVEREIRIHARLEHEHIIALYAAFEDDEHVYLAQEFASGGDLYEELKRAGGTLSEMRVSRDILGPCLSALAYLHVQGIIHRDIKPENCLLWGAAKAFKLADFGLSIDANAERPVTRAGTLDYMAPEVLVCPEKSRPEENKSKTLLGYTCMVDVWAVGILAFELAGGRPPFERETRAETYEHIMYRRPAFAPAMSDGLRHFVTLALTKAARKRPLVHELLRHPWIARAPMDVVPSYPRTRMVTARSLCALADKEHAAAAKPATPLAKRTIHITADCSAPACPAGAVPLGEALPNGGYFQALAAVAHVSSQAEVEQQAGGQPQPRRQPQTPGQRKLPPPVSPDSLRAARLPAPPGPAAPWEGPPAPPLSPFASAPALADADSEEAEEQMLGVTGPSPQPSMALASLAAVSLATRWASSGATRPEWAALSPRNRAGSALLPQRPGTAGGAAEPARSQGAAQPFAAWPSRCSASPSPPDTRPKAPEAVAPAPAACELARLKLSAGDALLENIKAYRGSLGTTGFAGSAAPPVPTEPPTTGLPSAAAARAFLSPLSRSTVGSQPRRCLPLNPEVMRSAREDLTQTPPPRKGFRFPSGRVQGAL